MERWLSRMTFQPFNNFADDKTKQMSYADGVKLNLNLLLLNALLNGAAAGF
jgi:hypothetical protein